MKCDWYTLLYLGVVQQVSLQAARLDCDVTAIVCPDPQGRRTRQQVLPHRRLYGLSEPLIAEFGGSSHVAVQSATDWQSLLLTEGSGRLPIGLRHYQGANDHTIRRSLAQVESAPSPQATPCQPDDPSCKETQCSNSATGCDGYLIGSGLPSVGVVLLTALGVIILVVAAIALRLYLAKRAERRQQINIEKGALRKSLVSLVHELQTEVITQEHLNQLARARRMISCKLPSIAYPLEARPSADDPGRLTSADSTAELMQPSGATSPQILDSARQHQPTDQDSPSGPDYATDAAAMSKLVWLEEPCPICDDEWRVGHRAVSLACGHRLHRRCALEWAGKQRESKEQLCPTCRANMFNASGKTLQT